MSLDSAAHHGQAIVSLPGVLLHSRACLPNLAAPSGGSFEIEGGAGKELPSPHVHGSMLVHHMLGL